MARAVLVQLPVYYLSPGLVKPEPEPCDNAGLAQARSPPPPLCFLSLSLPHHLFYTLNPSRSLALLLSCSLALTRSLAPHALTAKRKPFSQKGSRVLGCLSHSGERNGLGCAGMESGR
eukprot:2200932-Rhodomonas_salina.1